MILSGDGTSGLPSRLVITINAFCFVLSCWHRHHAAASPQTLCCLHQHCFNGLDTYTSALQLVQCIDELDAVTNPQLRHWQAAWLSCISEVAERQAQQS
jgi:hypothetical protein